MIENPDFIVGKERIPWIFDQTWSCLAVILFHRRTRASHIYTIEWDSLNNKVTFPGFILFFRHLAVEQSNWNVFFPTLNHHVEFLLAIWAAENWYKWDPSNWQSTVRRKSGKDGSRLACRSHKFRALNCFTWEMFFYTSANYKMIDLDLDELKIKSLTSRYFFCCSSFDSCVESL